MQNVTKQVEIKVRTGNDSASLSKLMATAVSCGAEVLAACSYWDRGGTVVMLVTDDAERTTHALEAADFRCTSTSIVLVEAPDKPGMAVLLGENLAAADIGVLYSYTFRSEGKRSYAVFKTTDDDRAVYLLEVSALIHDLAAAKSWRQPEHEGAPRDAAVEQMA